MIKRYRTFQQNGLQLLTSESRMTDTAFGSLEYTVQGDGTAILVAHGSFGGFDQGLWSVSFLKDMNARFIVPSRFGYLRTPLPATPTPEAQANAFVALLDTLAIERVWLLGLSAGGMSALQFALQFPSRCQGLIMISAVSRRPEKTPPIRFMVEHVFTKEFLGWTLATYWPDLVAQSTGDNYTLLAKHPLLQEAFLKLAWPPFATRRRVGMLNDLQQANNLPDYPFENITVPTLVIHGTADPFVPFSSAEHLAQRVDGAKLLTMEKGGHLSFLTHPETTSLAIREFTGTPLNGR